MLLPEEKQFIPIGFGFIDHCLRKIPPTALVVYLVLKRFVWRGKHKALLTPRYKAGSLCCSVSQGKIADVSGLSLATVKRNLNKLKKLGLVEARAMEGRDELVYMLGARVKTSDGKFEGEVYFVDGWINPVVEEGSSNLHTPQLKSSHGVDQHGLGDSSNQAIPIGIDCNEDGVVNREVVKLCAQSAHTSATAPAPSEKPQHNGHDSPVDAVANTPTASAANTFTDPDANFSGPPAAQPPVVGPRAPKLFAGSDAALLCGYLAKLVKESTHFEGIVMQAPTGKELALAKRLVENFGMEQARKMVECLALDWNAAKAKWRLYDEVPSMVVLQAHANDLAYAVKSGEGVWTPVHRCSEWSSRQTA